MPSFARSSSALIPERSATAEFSFSESMKRSTSGRESADAAPFSLALRLEIDLHFQLYDTVGGDAEVLRRRSRIT